MSKKIKVVQFCNGRSFYNDSLQNKLICDKIFKQQCDNIALYLPEIRNEYETSLKEQDRGQEILDSKELFWDCFNSYLYEKYPFDKKKDIVFIQFVWTDFRFLIPYLKKCFKRIILVFWGSDLLLRTKERQKLMSGLFDLATYIVLETNEMKTIFNKMIGNDYDNKIKLVKFGLSVFDIIDSVEDDDILEFCNKYCIDRRKKVITVGYNGLEAQRHLKVIDSMCANRINAGDVFLIFPWTYGNQDVEYKEKVEFAVRDKFDFVFLDSVLSWEEIGCLRLITDVLVHVRDTDSFSASMIETLYAKKTVVTGEWLPYDELYDKGVVMYTVKSVEDVGTCIKGLLDHQLSNEERNSNRRIAYETSSWEVNLPAWISLIFD